MKYIKVAVMLILFPLMFLCAFIETLIKYIKYYNDFFDEW